MIVVLFVVISLIAQISCKGEQVGSDRLHPAWKQLHEKVRRSSDNSKQTNSTQCKDEITDCDFYKNYGLCKYFLKECKRTCGVCGPPLPSTAPPPCIDQWDDCYYWVNRISDFCQRSTACERTCGICYKTTPPPPTQPKPSTAPPKPRPPRKCGKSKVQQSRIVAGVDAKKGAWPWIASMALADYYGEKNYHFCGGSLIHPNWILTAAHCVDFFNTSNKQQMDNFKIRLGVHNRTKNSPYVQDIGVEKIYIHHTWANRSNDNWHDVALVKLKRPALLTDRVQTVCLPDNIPKPAKGRRCYLAGWGTVNHPGKSPEILQQAVLPVVREWNCFNSTHMICAGYGTKSKTNACRGDSGGPYMCHDSDGSWTLHGVASFVVEYCKRYTSFADVGVYLDWIRKYAPV